MELTRSDPDLESLVRRIRDGELDLQPDFQRGEIWDKRRRQRLIDSVLRKWYIPAVHIVQEDGTRAEIVLDGQQRLAAIRDFFNDVFPVDGNIEPRDERIAQLHGLKFSQLPSDTQRALNRFTITSVTLRDYEPQEPNELFFRLNQSYNLTPPEKRNALYGRARQQIRELVERLQVDLLRAEVIGFSNGRLAYDDVVSRSCLALQRRDLRQHINNNSVEKFYREEEFSPEVIDLLARAGDLLLEQVRATQTRVRFNKATLFSWLIFCAWSPAVLGSPPPPGMLREFEAQRLSVKRNDVHGVRYPELIPALSLYDDRASSRVTDVSSVLARDVVLYLFAGREAGYPTSPEGLRLVPGPHHESDAETKQAILAYVQDSGWGRFPETIHPL